MPKSPEQFKPYSEQKAFNEASKIQKIMKRGGKDYEKAEQIIEKQKEIRSAHSREKKEGGKGDVQEVLALIGADKISISKNPDTQKRIREVEKFLSKLTQEESFSRVFFDSDSEFSKDFIQCFFEYTGGKRAPKLRELMRKKLENKFIVDLGSGNNPSMLEFFAKIGKIKGYIGADRFHENPELDPWDYRQIDKRDMIKKVKKEYGVDAIYVYDDMLRFVSSLPDNSVNFTMSGIDRSIISNEEYWERLAKEMTRTVEKDGIICGLNSEIEAYLGHGNKHQNKKYSGPEYRDIVPDRQDRQVDEELFFILEKTEKE